MARRHIQARYVSRNPRRNCRKIHRERHPPGNNARTNHNDRTVSTTHTWELHGIQTERHRPRRQYAISRGTRVRRGLPGITRRKTRIAFKTSQRNTNSEPRTVLKSFGKRGQPFRARGRLNGLCLDAALFNGLQQFTVVKPVLLAVGIGKLGNCFG